MHIDPDGTFVITLSAIITALIIGAVAGAIVGGIIGGVTAAANGQNVLYGILFGALGGAFAGAGAAVAGLFIAPALAGTTVTLAATGLGAAIGGTTLGAGTALFLGVSIAFVTGAVGGAFVEIGNQIGNYGCIKSWGDVGKSAIEGGVLNTINAFLGASAESIKIYLSGLGFDKFLSFYVTTVVNIITGAIGLILDTRNSNNDSAQKYVKYNFRKFISIIKV